MCALSVPFFEQCKETEQTNIHDIHEAHGQDKKINAGMHCNAMSECKFLELSNCDRITENG